MENITKTIVTKALEIGYLNCGILPLDKALAGYEERLDERYRRFPDDKAFKASDNYRMAHPENDYPWAKSVVICTIGLGDYHLPEAYRHRIGRIYAFDYRREKDAREFGWGDRMTRFLESLGFQCAYDGSRGLVPYRHVAQQAGIGIIRKNNFLYTEDMGSLVMLSAWLIDQKLERTYENKQKPCPPDCTRCQEACPTGSLQAPYAMHRRTCVSPLTSKYPEGDDITRGDIGLHFDGWLYGCDACQEACPFNRKVLARDHELAFPRQEEFVPHMTPEKILALDDDYLEEHFQPRFWYMPKGSTWKWKANAMCALLTEKNPDTPSLIRPYLAHANENLKKTAAWALEKWEEM